MEAENYVNRKSGYNLQDHIPTIQYPHTEEDSYDGIVFLIGHSEFKGRLSHCPTKKGMKHHTLLVANIGNICYWFSDPELFDSFIRCKLSDALSYLPTDIEDFIHTVKGTLGKLEKMSERIRNTPSYKKFFESRGKHSVDPTEYCEREWEFFTQDEHKKPEGRVLLLRRDSHGKPFFKVLYENEIDKGNFYLTKTNLFNKLYSIPYDLRNVLLVDFGCTNTTRTTDALGLQMLRRGYFG